MKSARTILFVALLSGCLNQHARAQTLACLQQNRAAIAPSTLWEKWAEYFRSLVRSPQAARRAKFIVLHKDIVDLEIHKRQLLAIIQKHIDAASTKSAAGSAGASMVTNEISRVIQRISDILARLDSMANDGDLFTTTDPWKKLKKDLAAKRAVSLCYTAQALNADNVEEAKKLALELKAEVDAIDEAGNALAEYIRTRFD
jgi:hypothetical protein